MSYQPKLQDGRTAPLPWMIRMIRSNLLVWPLANDVSNWWRWTEHIYLAVSFGLMLYLHYSNFYYFYLHFPNMAEILSCVPTYMVFTETQIRIYYMATHKASLKRFLQKFYANFYVEQSLHPQTFKQIQYKSIPTRYYSASYLLTYVLYTITLVIGWFRGEYGLMFKQAFPYDYRPLPIYMAHLSLNLWIGILVVVQFFGETNLLAMCVLNVNGRYQILDQQLQQFARKLLKNRNMNATERSVAYRRGLLRCIRQNSQLNEFVAEMQQIFSFQIFQIFIWSSVEICVVCVNLTLFGLNWDSIQFVSWLCAKVSELFVVGELGSTLTKTTSNLCNMYYEANWQEIIYRCDDSKENVRTLKLVLMAMQVNNRSLSLTAYGFIQLSLAAVLSILQGAFSYFTFLNQAR